MAEIDTTGKVRVFCLTYNKKLLPEVYDECYYPLQVGAAISGIDLYSLKDNEGDNISNMNPFWQELTGIYYIWRNNLASEYVGVEAYRRHLALHSQEIEDILGDGKHRIILPTPINLGKETNWHLYKRVNIENDIATIKEILSEPEYQEYRQDFIECIENGHYLYNGNGFITTKDEFNKICEFIFGVIRRYIQKMGFKTISDVRSYVERMGKKVVPGDKERNGMTWVDYQSMIGAFLSERLLTLYVYHNFKKDEIYHMSYTELGPIYRMENMKVLLCAIGRMENDYIREFVEYYKILGVDNICLFDNNYDGEEDFRDVIDDYIKSGFVILKDYRNLKKCQLDAYNECYQTYGKEYDWIMFFDVDEFMFLMKDKNIKEYLARNEFSDYEMIHINWLCYGDGDMLRSDGRPLLERIPTPIQMDNKTTYDFPDNYHIKSIVRGNLERCEWSRTPHTPIIKGSVCSASGKLVVTNSPFMPYDYRMAGLRHFTTKTADEYIKKIKRGFPDGTNPTTRTMVDIFFKRNKPTTEKIELFKKELGIDMGYLLPSTVEKRKDIQIFSLCYSKKDFKFLDDAVITPLQVGAANGTDVCVLKDNIGENISGKNYFFIENTGIYWIWKNVHDAKYKGQMQYRRPLSGISETFDFEKVFSEYDVITCEPFHHPSHKTPTKEEPLVIVADTVEEGYGFSNCIDDLYILEIFLKNRFPDYAEDYDKYIKNGPNLFYSNGFIMKSEDYDRYCEFLFTCLSGYLLMANIHNPTDLMEHVKYNIETGKYPRYPNCSAPLEAMKWQTEVGGFLSERIWTLWLQHNFSQERIYKLPYIKMEANMYT